MEKTTSIPVWFHFVFIQRTLGIVLTLLLMIGGWLGYRAMIKEALPDLAIPQALLMTVWPGAAPELVEKEITQRLERRIKGMAELKRYSSSSLESLSSIAVVFRAEADIDDAMQQLRNRVAEAEAEFPDGAEKPTLEQIAVREFPVATVVLFGDLDPVVLGQAAERLKKLLIRIPGLKKVALNGQRNEEIRVQLIPSRLQALGISVSAVKTGIEESGRDMPWGQFEHPHSPYSLKMSGAYRDLEALRALPVARAPQGQAVRLADIATVSRQPVKENTRSAISVDGDAFSNVTTLGLYKTPGRDTLQVIQGAKAAMAEAQQSAAWPAGMHYRLVDDESELIWDELKTAFNTGWQAMLMVFAILFMLLTWREAMVAALSIPITLLGAIAVLWALGYTFNILVIIGMILALGLLVDDFILIMEGIHEGIFVRGQNFAQAAWRTLNAYAVPSLSGTLTTLLVLLPLATLPGVDGKFIRLIPLTAAIALVLSYLVSLLVSLPLSGLVLDKKLQWVAHSRIDRITASLEGALRSVLLRRALVNRRRAAWLVGAGLGAFLVSLIVHQTLPYAHYPKQDGRGLGITVELPAPTSLAVSRAIGEAVGQVLRSKPYFTHVQRRLGAKDPYALSTLSDLLGASQGWHFIGFSCLLKPQDEREKHGFEYVESLRADIETVLKTIPDARLIITPETGGSRSGAPIQIDITGDDLDTLRAISADVQRLLSTLPGVVDIQDNLGQIGTHAALTPRREALDFYQLSEAQLTAQMRIYMADEKVGTLIMPPGEDDIPIRLGSAWRSRNGEPGGPTAWAELQQLVIITDGGEAVPLSALVERRLGQNPQVIPRRDGQRAVTVQAKLVDGTLNPILATLETQLSKAQAGWPVGYGYGLRGEKEAAEETHAGVQRTALISVVLVFAILALLFNSFIQPAMILFSVLFGLTGVFFAFLLLNLPLSFPAMIGIVALIGINVNDVIVMIDTMNRHRAQGHPLQAAAAYGAADRLRPIISTTVTTTLGLLPLAFADPGWMPLCTAIISGELVSTVTSLVLIPCLYLVLNMATTLLPEEVIAYANYTYGHLVNPKTKKTVFIAPDDHECWWSAPSGNGFTAVGDLARWALLLMEGGGDVLSPSSVEAMQTRQVSKHDRPGEDYG